MARIGFTYDLKSDFPLKNGSPRDFNAEFDYEDTIETIKKAIEKAGHEVVAIGGIKKLLEKIYNLDVDIVFNICEGIHSRNREAQVPVVLETFNIPYIGSDGLTLSLTLDKVMTKKVLVSEKIPTPKFLSISKKEDLIDLDHMVFPMIVKLRNEGSSKGISDKSIVNNKKELSERAKFLFSRYSNAPLIMEELILGSEFTVPVIGNDNPEAFPPVQVSINGQLDLGEEIYTFERITNNELHYVCPAQIDKKLDRKIRNLALKTYKAVDCLDFARVDFRVDQKGNPYVLEINPLPSLSTDDAFGISPKVVGCDFDQAIAKIIDAGLKRYGLN